MPRLLRTILALCVLGCPAFAQEPVDDSPFVIVCPINEEIGPGIQVIVQRAVREAEGASLIIFVIDTPGGRLDSALEITNAIMDAPCPTVAYLEGMGAISAGALISYACDYIVMGRASSIGASTPYMPGVEMSEDVQEKSYSYLRSRYRALGEEKGHNVLLGEAMVDRQIALHANRDEDGNLNIYKVLGEKYNEKTTEAPPEVKKDLLDMIFDGVEGGDDIKREVRKAMDKPAPEGAAPEDAGDEVGEDSTGGQPLPEGTELICGAGELLTLSANQAVEYDLAVAHVTDIDEALELFNAHELRRVEIVPNWAEGLYAWLSSPLISGLLLMCAVGGLYLEVRTPGFGLPGVIGVCCLAVFLGTQFVVGLANFEDVILIVVGLGLIVIELFILPGFGVVGAAGILSLIAGLYLSLVRVPIPEFAWDFEVLANATYTLTVALGLLAMFIVVSWRFLPRSFIFRWLTLADSQEVDEGYVVQTREDVDSAVGQWGVAKTVLRPAGRGRFGSKTYDIVTRGEYLEAGTAVEIIRAEGNRYVVAEIREKSE